MNIMDGIYTGEWDTTTNADGTDTRTYVLKDGTKITLQATGSSGVITSANIYDNGTIYHIDTSTNTVTGVTKYGATAKTKEEPDIVLQAMVLQTDQGRLNRMEYSLE